MISQAQIEYEEAAFTCFMVLTSAYRAQGNSTVQAECLARAQTATEYPEYEETTS